MFLSQLFQLIISDNLWRPALQFGALLLLPALGGVISERSGVVNIAMEGMMLTGAFFSAILVLSTHNVVVAVLVAILTGGLMALVHAFFSIQFKADQIVSGVAINIAALGLTGFLLPLFTNGNGVSTLPAQLTLPYLDIPGLSHIPFIGPAFLQQNVVFYIAIAVLLAMQYVLFHTNVGLRIRSVGEHPQAADTAGINVRVIRYWCVITSGLLSGLAGAFLALGVDQIFNPNLTSGAGFIALAAMIFGKWKPWNTALACLIFGLGEALQSRVNLLPATGVGIVDIPLHSPSLVATVPYILTIVALVGVVGRATAPAADGIPYEPGGE
ncbi:MAG TPA: ABC transporter permease [Ktedonobacterales bacterium]|jgi:simple sugar transport system permease protein